MVAQEREAELAARPPKLPRPRPLDPTRGIKPAHDPEAVIMTDGGFPKAKQDPPESVEAIDEPETAPESEKPAQQPSWPPPGRAHVTRESLCDRLF